MRKIAIFAAMLVVAGTAQAGELLRLKATGLVRGENLPGMASLQGNAGIYLVQWRGSVSESEKAEVESLGLRLVSYIPDDAFLFQGNASQARKAEHLAFVRHVLPFSAALKLEPELTKHGVFSFREQAQVSIQLAPGADPAAVSAELVGGQDVGYGLVTGGSDVGGLWKIAQRPDVLWIERYLPMRSLALSAKELGADTEEGMGTQTGYESGVKIVNADAMHARGMTGQGQIIAVSDTGLDTGEMGTLTADFQGQVKIGLAMGLGGKSWGDPMMHGTHVAGSILGSGTSSNNLIRGAAFGGKLVMQGLWSDIMNNIMPPAIPKLLDAGYNNGARIHSNSWGAPGSAGRYDNWAVLTDTWLFDHPDYLAMFASGNEGVDMNRDGVIDQGAVGSPATAKNVLAVGASKNFLMEGGIQRPMKELREGGNKWGIEPIASSRLSDDQRGMAAFSSRGPAADGRIKPEIVAPGTNIVSARDKHPKADPATMSWGIYDDNYVYMGGTSMSCPVAAGAVALARQFLVAKLGTEMVSAALLKATVANTAEDLFPGQFGERSSGQEQPMRRPNNHQGWGRVNMANLVNDQALSFVDERTGLATGQAKEFTVSVTNSKIPLRVTLAYTDAPGTAAAQRVLVNDLDLSVQDPSGRTLFPNGRSDKDSVNNMEEVDVLAPAPGTYKVLVRAANVPQGKNGAQPFALVISSGRPEN